MFGKGCKDGVHKFEARFDRIPINQTVEQLFWQSPLWDQPVKKIYVHDICVRCGKAVKRDG